MKVLLLSVGAVLWATTALAAEPLPSWNDTAPKQAIIQFVEKVTQEGSADFVPPPAAAGASASMSVTPMRNASGPTIASPP